MKSLDIKAMMAMIKDEPEDQYIPVLKSVLLQALTEIKQLRRKNSQLGGKVARYRKKDTPAYPFPAGNNECDYILCVALLVITIWKMTKKIDAVAIVGSD